MRILWGMATGFAAAACGPQPVPCGDGILNPGVVCLRAAPVPDRPHAPSHSWYWTHTLADFDGDGVDDLLMRSPERLTVQLNRGDATFDAEIDLAALDPSANLVGDLDGNGRAEFLRPIDDVRANLMELDAGILVARRVVPYEESGVVSVGDFDGNGLRDLVYCPADSLTVHFGSADGSYRAVEHEPVSCDDVVPLVVADLDGDGADELLHADDGITRLRYGPDLDQSIVVEMQLWSGALGDVDGDGDVELVDRFAGDVRVIALDRLGEPPEWSAELMLDGSDLLLADIDADGAADFVLPGVEIGRVHLSDGERGSIADAVSVPHLRHGGWGPFWETAQLNDDGLVDLARFYFSDAPVFSAYAGGFLSDP